MNFSKKAIASTIVAALLAGSAGMAFADEAKGSTEVKKDAKETHVVKHHKRHHKANKSAEKQDAAKQNSGQASKPEQKAANPQDNAGSKTISK